MFSGSFDPTDDAILIDVELRGPLGKNLYLFVLDTGTAVTTVDPGVLDELGYSPRMGRRMRRSIGVGGTSAGYSIEIERIQTMGLGVERAEVICTDLPSGVDGLIGTDLLRGRILTIDWIRGALAVGP